MLIRRWNHRVTRKEYHQKQKVHQSRLIDDCFIAVVRRPRTFRRFNQLLHRHVLREEDKCHWTSRLFIAKNVHLITIDSPRQFTCRRRFSALNNPLQEWLMFCLTSSAIWHPAKYISAFSVRCYPEDSSPCNEFTPYREMRMGRYG